MSCIYLENKEGRHPEIIPYRMISRIWYNEDKMRLAVFVINDDDGLFFDQSDCKQNLKSEFYNYHEWISRQ